MEFGPILRSMTRNKTGAVLIALQIAFTMTVIVNGFFIIAERVKNAGRPSGMVEDELFHILSNGFASDFNERVTVEEDLALLRETPGIVDAVQINSVPLSGGGWSTGLKTAPSEDTEGHGVAVYMVDSHGIGTLGVELIAGENFKETDVTWRLPAQSEWPDKVIITEAVAATLFPDEDPLNVVGKTAYIDNTQPITIVGMIKRLQAPWNSWDGVERAMLVPERMAWRSARYLVRTEPGRREEMMPLVEELLAASNSGRIVRNLRSMGDTRKESYLLDKGLATILTVVMVVLVIITALGIVGLASFSVKRRTKQIGTRRALGATRTDILRYFLVENFLITTIGVLLGGAMTVGFNIWLVESMSFPKIDWLFVPIGMLALWLIGLLAVFGPARRASDVEPAIATRTV